jgi:hypothetical protein
MRAFIALFLVLTLSACGPKGEQFLGLWKGQGDKFDYLLIERNGDDFIAKKYSLSLVFGDFEEKIYPVAIKENTLTIGNSGHSGVYIESDRTLSINSSTTYAKASKDELLTVIEEAKAKVDCKAVQKAFDSKGDKLTDKAAWDIHLESAKKTLPFQKCQQLMLLFFKG